MSNEKVVKCGNKQCGLYFGYSEKKTACPFCHTEYGKVEKETKENNKDKKGTEEKRSAKTSKESFKVWKN